MKVFFSKKFKKDFSRLDQKIRLAVKNRIQIFSTDPYHIELSNHPLKGKFQNYRSINISGDFRAVYKEISEAEVMFTTIGTHSQLYR